MAGFVQCCTKKGGAQVRPQDIVGKESFFGERQIVDSSPVTLLDVRVYLQKQLALQLDLFGPGRNRGARGHRHCGKGNQELAGDDSGYGHVQAKNLHQLGLRPY